ncbi:MAG TPA: hypothetical protein VKP65_00455 [Rhodothermales bacterium]|nr:hypothetical protein [Rhodothermales bacterium]
MKIEQPRRVTRTYTQRLVVAPDKVFPLLCPVREGDWIEGWDPVIVYTHSGVAEQDCVFITAAQPSNAVWFITRHEPEQGFVEMLKITPDVTACKLTIQLRPVQGGSEAEITYSYTSLGPAGDAVVDSFTEDYYEQFMREWEQQINHYLTHGTLLSGK